MRPCIQVSISAFHPSVAQSGVLPALLGLGPFGIGLFQDRSLIITFGALGGVAHRGALEPGAAGDAGGFFVEYHHLRWFIGHRDP